MTFDKARMAEYYEDLLAKHGDHYLSLDWKSPESQGIRYRIFEDLIFMMGEREGFSVLDVGCGFGDFFGHLKKGGFKFDYTGYDISYKIVDRAARKYPEANFEVRDILNDPDPQKFDFVFCCGALNINFEDAPSHLEYARSMLLRMFELCKIGAGVSLLSSQAMYFVKEDEFNRSQYFYFKPEDIIGFAKGLTSRYILRHDYHAGDFTVYLIK
ncbi:methyltransferase domain-containing protein [Candidatus Saganbacteria bacterium]|nr:methyltransferase domain-containing protein [Candidatus Saganbacteria bacterium]